MNLSAHYRSPVFPKANNKRCVVLFLVTIIFSAIAALFWYNQVVYSLPTPVPLHYKNVAAGTKVSIPALSRTSAARPLFLHFFNPDCPCSKFNMPYFKSLTKKYGGEAAFAMVVMSNKNYTATQIQKKFGLAIPVLFDTGIAAACGVYSTPQAVIIDAGQKLYYRGNYNRSRYCTNAKTNYAEQALDSLLQHPYAPFITRVVQKAYGCRLPVCSK